MRITIGADGWQSVGLSASCANIWRNTPNSDDTFLLRRSPHQTELAMLMPVLARSAASDEIAQAAVWIVTDNADYSDLGVLVSGFGGFGPRVILEKEAAIAMKICQKEGIDIQTKKIWEDHERIYWWLEVDDPARKWIETQNPSLASLARDLLTDIEARLVAVDLDALEALHATPLSVSVSVTDSPRLSYAAWLVGYLKDGGHKARRSHGGNNRELCEFFSKMVSRLKRNPCLV
jgi:hypothetical protein